MLDRVFDLLPPVERAQRYREMAEAAFLTAADAPTPEIKGSYLNLAASWHALASGLEKELDEEEAAASDNLAGPPASDA